VNVEFQMVIDANHSQLRMLGQPKNTFKDDNMSKFIAFTIKSKLEKNPNFKFIENPTGFVFDNIEGYNLLGIHGEVKSMERALRDFSAMYKVDVNYLVAGHLHHNKREEIGFDTEVINIGSVVGIDDYSVSLGKTSNASATLIGFEKDKGKFVEYTIKLN
jgi:UDP-2,3-diacylglucosamine pyrophosphatase LpxH